MLKKYRDFSISLISFSRNDKTFYVFSSLIQDLKKNQLFLWFSR